MNLFETNSFLRYSISLKILLKTFLITKNITNMRREDAELIQILKVKSKTKQIVYDQTKAVFEEIKVILDDISKDYNDILKDEDSRIHLAYNNKSEFECELKVAGDLLIFSMHTNIFEFYRAHNVWKTSYLQDNKEASFSGIINIYNFLSDSFKYYRKDDLGYLIGRIFINKDKQYFVEGKRELGSLYHQFGNFSLDKERIRNIITSAIHYTLNFDLLVPPYDHVKIATVEQIVERFNTSKMVTGKRLGFKFYADEF